MKAITLWEPWATYIALGIKSIETRGWSTPYRGPLAIHAAKRRPPTWYHQPGDERGPRNTDGAPWIDELERFCELYPDLKDDWCAHVWTAPLGVVLATADLVDVAPIGSPDGKGSADRIDEYPHEGDLPHQQGGLWLTGPRVGMPTRIEDQRPYGDFTDGRYGWILADIKPLASPVPATGRQQLWEWDDTNVLVS